MSRVARACICGPIGYPAGVFAKAGYPEFVTPLVDEEMEEYTDEDGFVSYAGTRLTMCYDKVIPVVAKAVAHLLDENAALKQQVEDQQAQITALQAKLDALISLLGVTL
jgi:predicted RNase H-like nuclease (RuvC/YqgF family)